MDKESKHLLKCYGIVVAALLIHYANLWLFFEYNWVVGKILGGAGGLIVVPYGIASMAGATIIVMWVASRADGDKYKDDVAAMGVITFWVGLIPVMFPGILP